VLARDHEFLEVHGNFVLDTGVVAKTENLFRHIKEISHMIARVVKIAGGSWHEVAMNLLVLVVRGDKTLPFDVVLIW
jgi:hypothetical protein